MHQVPIPIFIHNLLAHCFISNPIMHGCVAELYVMEYAKSFTVKNSVSIPSWQNSGHKENAIPPPPPTPNQILRCNVDKMFFYVHMIGKGETT